MKRTILNSIAIGVLVLSAPMTKALAAHRKVVYGVDNRVEVDEAPARYAQWAKATAGMIYSSLVNLDDNGKDVTIYASTLEQYGVCSSERFADQPTAVSCSGFLVGPDLLVTAGHCIKSNDDCQHVSWIFGYDKNSYVDGVVKLPRNNVYRCAKLISRSQSLFTRNDYALIRLDRKVVGRTPLRVSRRKPKVGTDLVIIGHPTGLPTKIAAGAKVRKKHWKYFSANLDSFGGNSGSAVINERTGEVVGILVRGDNDYVDDGNCMVVNHCPDNGCRGEDATYITNVKGLK